MAQVILLTDITDNKESIHFSRYIAPYILATNIRKMGYSCVVLDYFTKFDNLFEILKKLIDEKTIFIGMAGTFLSLQEYDESDLILNNLPYSAGYLWLNSKAEFESWIEKIRNIVKDNNSKALLALGGTKALFFLQSSEKRNLFDFYVIGKAEQFIDQLIHLLDTTPKFHGHTTRELAFYTAVILINQIQIQLQKLFGLNQTLFKKANPYHLKLQKAAFTIANFVISKSSHHLKKPYPI